MDNFSDDKVPEQLFLDIPMRQILTSRVMIDVFVNLDERDIVETKARIETRRDKEE